MLKDTNSSMGQGFTGKILFKRFIQPCFYTQLAEDQASDILTDFQNKHRTPLRKWLVYVLALHLFAHEGAHPFTLNTEQGEHSIWALYKLKNIFLNCTDCHNDFDNLWDIMTPDVMIATFPEIARRDNGDFRVLFN